MSWAGGTSGKFAWEHTQGRKMTGTATPRGQLSSSACGSATRWIVGVSSLSSVHLAQASESPAYPLLLHCVRNLFHINPDQNPRKLNQLKKPYDEFHGQAEMICGITTSGV